MKRAAILVALGVASTRTFAQASPETPEPPSEPRALATTAPVPVSKPPAQADPSTSAMWRPRRHFDLHWQLLLLPERIVSLVFVPIELLVGAVEKYRLDRRLFDLLTFYDGRITLHPRFKFNFGDGLGGGFWLRRSELFERTAEIQIGGIARVNLDWQVELEYKHRLLLPGGRGVRARAYIENDKDQRFYGIGGQSLESDRRVLASFDEGVVAEVDLQGIDRDRYSGIAQLGFRRQSLSPGVDPTDTPLTINDTVVPPPGFGESATFIDAQLVGRYDTRDTVGRPTRGVFLETSVLARSEISGASLSSATWSGTLQVHLPVLPDHRVLVVSLGGAATRPLFSGDQVPLDSLPVIGRNNVRGYDRERFRDRYVVVASAEYRFPIYEYLSSGAGLDAFAFYDAGTVWGQTAFSLDPLRYSFGGGLRAAHEPRLVSMMTIGWSPDGLQVNVGLEKAL